MVHAAPPVKHGATEHGTVNTLNEQQPSGNRPQYVGFAAKAQETTTHGQQTMCCPATQTHHYDQHIAPATAVEATNHHHTPPPPNPHT